MKSCLKYSRISIHRSREVNRKLIQLLLKYFYEYGENSGNGHYLFPVRGRGDCVTTKFTWSSHKAQWYPNDSPYQKYLIGSQFYIFPRLCSVGHDWYPLCNPWKPLSPPKILHPSSPALNNNWYLMLYNYEMHRIYLVHLWNRHTASFPRRSPLSVRTQDILALTKKGYKWIWITNETHWKLTRPTMTLTDFFKFKVNYTARDRLQLIGWWSNTSWQENNNNSPEEGKDDCAAGDTASSLGKKGSALSGK